MSFEEGDVPGCLELCLMYMEPHGKGAGDYSAPVAEKLSLEGEAAGTSL